MSTNISYTSKDYDSIYEELLSLVSDLTDKWKPSSETDPGIVLIKLMAYLGDMLSYNQDKMFLELFPATVTQRKNAYTLFKSLGYTMSWYKTAVVTLTLSNDTDKILTLKNGTEFISDDYITKTFTYLGNDISIPVENSITIDVVEGALSTLSDQVVSELKIYLRDAMIGENTLILIDGDGSTWTLVDNVLAQDSYSTKYYAIGVDEYDNPYIEMPTGWVSWLSTNESSSKFTIQYAITEGYTGLSSTISLSVVVPSSDDGTTQDLYDNVTISLDSITQGNNYETPDEARNNFDYTNATSETLVTTSDFIAKINSQDFVVDTTVLDVYTDRINYTTDSTTGYVMVEPISSSSTSTDTSVTTTSVRILNKNSGNMLVYPQGIDGSAISEDEYSSIIQDIQYNSLLGLTIVDKRKDIIVGEVTPVITLIYSGTKTDDEKDLIIADLGTYVKNYINVNAKFGSKLDYLTIYELISNYDNSVTSVSLDNFSYTYRCEEGLPDDLDEAILLTINNIITYATLIEKLSDSDDYADIMEFSAGETGVSSDTIKLSNSSGVTISHEVITTDYDVSAWKDYLNVNNPYNSISIVSCNTPIIRIY